MDFNLTDGQRMMMELARDFARREIAPIAKEIDEHQRFPQEVFKKSGEIGLTGIGIPLAYGGSECDYLSIVLIGEEISKVSASVTASLFPHAILCAHNIALSATDAQKRQFLPPLALGEKFGAMALTEVSAGSDALAVNTRAERKNDGYVLNGSKTFVTNGPFADLFLIYANLDPSKSPEGIAIFVVEKGTPGLSVGREFDKMGLRGSPTSDLILDHCYLPKETLLGEKEGLGLRQLMRGLDVERMAWSSICLGLAEAAFEEAFEYANQRQQFKKPIIEFQMIQQMLVEMLILIEGSKLMVYKTAVLLQEGKRARLEASYAKLFSSETAIKVTRDALQIFGGSGYMKDYPVERYLRDAQIFTIGAGTSEVQKMIVIHELKKQKGYG
jgi:alkylation response protein AidB-like acyl-CoA dehydrogenase